MSAGGVPGQMPFDYGLAPSHHEADFIEGDGNRLALAHIRAYPNWLTPLTLIEGPPKSGKSHIGQIWAARSGAYVAAADELVDLSREGGRLPLIIENVDSGFYEEDASFHLLNQSLRDGRPLLLTARKSIANWPFETDDFKSRVRLAARFRIELSDDIQLAQMFVKLFEDRQVVVDPKVVGYLVARMERSPEEAVALADLVDSIALGRGSAITRSVAAMALAARGGTRVTAGNSDDE